MNGGPNRWLLILVILLAPILGWLKVEYQRDHPPEWARKPIHQYEGYVSIDGHARRAAQVRDVLRGDDSDARALTESLRSDLHPTSLLVPALVGALALLTGSIPIAFLLINLVAYGLTLWLIARIARRHLEELGVAESRSRAGWCVLVFAAHVDTCRDVMQLHLDFAVTCLGLAASLAALDALKNVPGRARAAWLVAGAQALGVFTKASFAPFLAVLPIATLLGGSSRKRWVVAVVSLAIPGILVAAYVLALRGDGSIARDATHFVTATQLSTGQLSRFAFELALALQWLPLVAFLPRVRTSRVARFVLAIAGLYLASLLAFGLPAVPRLYLPAIALLCALSAPLLGALVQRSGKWPVYAWVGVNLAMAMVGMRYRA